MRITIKVVLLFFISQMIMAQTYDLEAFIERVKNNNKDILIAKKDKEIAETQDKEARANAYPRIDAEATYNRNLKDAYMYADFGDLGNAFPGMGGTQKFKINYKNEFGLQTVVSQQIFNYTVFNAIKAAEQYEKLSDYAYDATIQGVINGSKKAFYQALLLKEVWKVKKASLKNAKQNYDNIKNKFNNGLVSKFDLLQAEVRWKNLVPEETQSKRNYQLAINALKSLADLPLEKEMSIVGDFEKYPIKPDMMELQSVLTNRPDYNALVWEKRLRETNIDVERSGHFPNLYASFVYRYSSMSDEFSLERENNYLIAGLTLKVPIFSGWGVSSKVERAKIESMQTEIKIDKKKDKIYTDLTNIDLKMSEAKNRINSATKTLEAAKTAFRIAENSSKNGLATQLELKDARIQYDKAQLNFYSAVYDYLEAYFDWELAVGAL